MHSSHPTLLMDPIFVYDFFLLLMAFVKYFTVTAAPGEMHQLIFAYLAS